MVRRQQDELPERIRELLGKAVAEETLLAAGMIGHEIRPLALPGEMLLEAPPILPGSIYEIEDQHDAIHTPALRLVPKGELLRPVAVVAVRRTRNVLGLLVPIGLVPASESLVRKFALFLETALGDR